MTTELAGSATRDWVEVAALEDLADGRRVVKVRDRQLAIFRSAGEVYAIDNRCPHQGYPLALGSLNEQSCVLTCDWHNWKFRLNDGANVGTNGEAVGSYEVRIADGRIFVDLTAEPVEDAMARHLESMREGLVRFEGARVARDAARLLELGMLPAEVMRQGALHSAEREEYGWGHALAVIADCMSLSEFYGEDEASVPVVRALFSASEPTLRLPPREFAPPEPAHHEGEEEFRRRVEDEEVDGAEAFLRGAIESGVHQSTIERWLLNSASDHFLGFGHEMIYVHKAKQMASRVGWDGLATVIPSLVPSIVWATRYDKLPEMRKHTDALHDVAHELPDLAAKQGRPTDRWDAARFRHEILYGKGIASFEAVHAALKAGVRADTIAAQLVLAASERILRMDLEWEVSHDEPTWDDSGWLEVTHLLTHANATRALLRRDSTAEALRSLYHSAWFINTQGKFDQTDGLRADERTLPEAPGRTPEELATALRDAIRAKRTEEAMSIVRRFATDGLPDEELLRALGREAIEVDDGRFIMVARVLKTAHAAIEEYRDLGGVSREDAFLPLMAATRYLASPRKQNPVYDQALNGVQFVRSGAAKSV